MTAPPSIQLPGRAIAAPARQPRLGSDILLITAILWLANFAILTTRSASLGIDSGPREIGIRFVSALVGFLLTLCVYAAFRARLMSPLRRFLAITLTCIPISFLLAAGTETAWLLFTDFYSSRYGITAEQIFSGRCTAPGGCTEFRSIIIYSAAEAIWIYIACAALYISTLIAAEVRDRDRRLAAAESSAHQAQLMALRFQLNPHFLFNTLNTLSGLVALGRSEQAERILINLSAFLRRALRNEPQQNVPLKSEIEGEQMYLDIERARFGNRLRVELDIPPECEAACVPAFILQPLVENSIKHAVAMTERRVTIRISARRANDQLEVAVENSDPGRNLPDESSGFGIGLENVRLRLAAVYGSEAALEVTITADGRWVNLVKVPWMEQVSGNARIDR